MGFVLLRIDCLCEEFCFVLKSKHFCFDISSKPNCERLDSSRVTNMLYTTAALNTPNLRRVELTSKFVNKVVASEHHPLHPRIPSTPGNFLPRQRLLSRQPFTRHAALLHGIPQFNIMESWMNIWSSARSRLVEFGLSPANKLPPGSDLSRK